MSLLKSELKQQVTTEVGVRVEDALDSAKNELIVLEARKVAFHEGARTIEALMAHVDKDLEEEKFDPPTALLIKRYIERGVHALQNMSQLAQNFMVAQSGRVQGLKQTVDLLKAIVDDEAKKIEQVKAAMAAQTSSGPVGLRPDGVRPALSIKEQRLAEEAAEAPVSETGPREEEPRAANT